MVGHEITTKENLSAPKNSLIPRKSEEDFKKFFQIDHISELEVLQSVAPSSEKRLALKKKIHTRNYDYLSDISSELLLNISTTEYTSTSASKEIKQLERGYMNNMEKFLAKMDEFMLFARNIHSNLLKSLREFLVISRGTAYIILGSSIANFSVIIGNLLHKIFRFSWNSKLFLIPTVTGALSFTTSLITFAYMNQTTNNFSKDLRKETWLLRDLITVHQQGDWIDEAVSKLFPYGINLNLIDFEHVNYFKVKHAWKEYLGSRIIYSNIEKDKKLLKNEDFLIKVKLFVENPAAEIWWSRMRIKKLLEEIRDKANETSAKQFLSSHENLIYRTALYVYPVIIPWLFISRGPEEMKFIITTLGGFLSALELGNDGSEELDNLKKMYLNFEKDFKKIYNICDILDGGEE